MRLSEIEFTNFRCFRSETLRFSSYTSLVGPNNCGKSTALRALNILFGGGVRTSGIQAEDFFIGADLNAELSLRFEFVDVIGAAASALSHYVRGGRVVFEIVATRDEHGVVTSRCRGVRYGLAQLAPFFAASRANDKRPIYEQLQQAFPGELPRWRNVQEAEEAVRQCESARPGEHVAIPSDESAYGATGPIPKLKKYIDWIYVPAVKEVSTEASEQRESAFSKLIAFAVRSRCNFADQIAQIKVQASTSLREALEGAADALAEVGRDIDREFKNLTTTPIDVSIDWGPTEDIAVREPIIRSIFKDGRVLGSPEIFGHGLQRTYLMALLSLAARTQGEGDGFQLLLGIEEPELYQHPPQARFLASALSDLSERNCQVVVTTHSPHFISGRTFESVRSLRKRENTTQVHSWSVDEQRAYVAHRKGVAPIGAAAALSGLDRAMQPNVAEMFFAGKVILMEGQEDVAIIESYLRCTGSLGAFLKAGCHLVACGGKTKMPMLVALARGFRVDVYTLCDFDLDKAPQDQKNGEIIRYAAEVGDAISDPPEGEFSGNFFFGWQTNVQGALALECDKWLSTKQAVAQEWGWSLDRMDKDPMLLAEVISRLVGGRTDLPPLARVARGLEQFWSQ